MIIAHKRREIVLCGLWEAVPIYLRIHQGHMGTPISLKDVVGARSGTIGAYTTFTEIGSKSRILLRL